MPVRLDARLLTTARALLRWQPDDLARRAGVTADIIEAIELKTAPQPHSASDNDALVAACEGAGLEFGEINGVNGVWLRARPIEDGAPMSIAPERLNASNDK